MGDWKKPLPGPNGQVSKPKLRGKWFKPTEAKSAEAKPKSSGTQSDGSESHTPTELRIGEHTQRITRISEEEYLRLHPTESFRYGIEGGKSVYGKKKPRPAKPFPKNKKKRKPI